MEDKIQSVKDSWESHKDDYLEDAGEAKAREGHLKDWAGDSAVQLWRPLAKELGIDFDLSEIQDALVGADGDVESAIEDLKQEAAGDFFWIDIQEAAEAFTSTERNLSLIGA